ncbi:MAG TPA: flagellar assembly protein FliX [Alphaproteobacteria bacterium]|nr:flagellar assembly protein FliX [Alphaproteobacteria bacterium]
MVDFKISGPGGIRGTSSTKGARRSTAPTGPSFADMLDQASAVEGAEPTAASLPNLPYAPLPDDPGTARQQANTLLESLTALADDALAGNPARALADLQAALQQNPPDRATLTPPQQQAIDELATRAAVEVAKRGG